VNQISASSPHNLTKLTTYRVIEKPLMFTNQILGSPQAPPEMTSLHQCLDHRWSSNTRAIVDRPPSQPPSRRQMSGIPCSGSEKESHHKDPGAGNCRRGSPGGRLQRSNSKWTSGSGVVTDSPPLQPHSHRGLPVLWSPPRVHRYNRSVAEKALSEGSTSRVVRDGVRFLKPPLTRQRTRRSFARGHNYPQILHNMIVQGLIRIEENEVTFFCQGEDETTVKKVLPAAVKEYVDIMKRETTVLLEPVVSVNADRPKDLTDKSYGGILLYDERATKQGLGTPQALSCIEES
jgi:hypothetical protein